MQLRQTIESRAQVSRMAKSRKRYNRSKLPFFILGATLGVLLIVYIIISFHFKNHFFLRTTFDQVDISGMTLEEARTAVDDMIENYTLLITDRDGNTYRLSASDCGLTQPDDDLLETTLSSQNYLLWIGYFLTGTEVTQDFSESYNANKLQEAVLSLDCFDEDNIVAPEDATIAYNADTDSFEVVEEVMGTTLITANVLEKVTTAITSLELTLTLDDDDYQNPSIYSDDESLNAAITEANSALGVTITYDIDGAEEVAGTDTVGSWISIGDDFTVSYDEDAIAEYVDTLAKKYNTYGDEREFKTALGDTITIGGGDYGWVIDKSGEAEQILSDLKGGEPVEREPVYEQTAVTRTENSDIGWTYIEVDLSNQHMYYIENGEIKLESDIVSGNITLNNGTPDGVFKIIYKQRNATLVGEDYESEVSYFMPFAYNVGFHDASWRSSFGGSIYKKSGSHGCINMPSSAAEQLYELVATDTPVVVYYRTSVKLTSENAQISNAYSYYDEEDDEE